MTTSRLPRSPGAWRGPRPEPLQPWCRDPAAGSGGPEREIEAMDIALQRLRLGRDGRSAMLTGLRGVGKTVLLNEFEQLAQGRGYFHEHVEVNEDGDLQGTSSGPSRWPRPSSTTASSECGPAGPPTPNGPISGPWPSSVPVPSGRGLWPSSWARRRPPSDHPRRLHQEGRLLLPPLGRDRLHRPHVRQLHEAMDPELASVVDRSDL
jgi:hypothetical protein